MYGVVVASSSSHHVIVHTVAYTLNNFDGRQVKAPESSARGVNSTPSRAIAVALIPDILEVALPSIWLYGISASTGWPSVSIL